ncbi:MAG: hypothetical protein J5744_04730 [Oscillospiraceae bacterium]|nr:hypothetical protein [Oscillospiraceae bacterium]
MTKTVSRHDFYTTLLEAVTECCDSRFEAAGCIDDIDSNCEDMACDTKEMVDKLDSICALLSDIDYSLDKLLGKVNTEEASSSDAGLPF